MTRTTQYITILKIDLTINTNNIQLTKNKTKINRNEIIIKQQTTAILT